MLSLGGCGLPKGGERTSSTAMTGNNGTTLAAAVRPRVAAHPGQSGLHELPIGEGALAARLVLAEIRDDFGNSESVSYGAESTFSF